MEGGGVGGVTGDGGLFSNHSQSAYCRWEKWQVLFVVEMPCGHLPAVSSSSRLQDVLQQLCGKVDTWQKLFVFLMCDGINECRCLWLHNVKVWRPSSHRFFVYVLTLEREPYFLSFFSPVPSFNSLSVLLDLKGSKTLLLGVLSILFRYLTYFGTYWRSFSVLMKFCICSLFLSICRMGILRMMPFVSWPCRNQSNTYRSTIRVAPLLLPLCYMILLWILCMLWWQDGSHVWKGFMNRLSMWMALHWRRFLCIHRLSVSWMLLQRRLLSQIHGNAQCTN